MVRIRLSRERTPKYKAQLELDFHRSVEKDRNYHLGGRSFYFFDFDDNVAYLTTPILIFNKKSGHEIKLSSSEWAKNQNNIGKSGVFKDYFVDYNDEKGSFRYFRDQKFSFVDRIVRKKQTFLTDIQMALEKTDLAWKAPSWNCFYHATFNKRPTSVITARGHNVETIQEGIALIVNQGHLPYPPNYLSIYPVSNPKVRAEELQDPQFKYSVADLKRAAIRNSVEKAIRLYGKNPHHRFGMSDDDPKNVELITEELKLLKRSYPEMGFFVIQTFEDSFVKTEVLETKTTQTFKKKERQLNLFEQDL